MTPAEQNAAIAGICGSLAPEVQRPESLWPDVQIAKACNSHCVLNYCGSLDAMSEAEKVLEGPMILDYVNNLFCQFNQGEGWDGSSIRQVFFPLICATAAQRAEAFLKTLNKWSAQ